MMTRSGNRIVIGLAAAFAAATALPQPRPVFTDKGDTMRVAGISSWNIEEVPKSNGVYRFTGAGKQVKGTWEKGDLTILTSKIDGQARGSQNGPLELQSAHMSGGVVATIKRPSTNRKSSSLQTVVINGREATYVSASRRLDVLGGVNLANSDPGSRRLLTMRGSTAVVVLSRQGPVNSGDAVESSSMKGPGVLELDTTEVGAAGVVRKAHTVMKAGNIDYAKLTEGDSGPGRKVILTGDVDIKRTSVDTKDRVEVPGSNQTMAFKGSSAVIVLGSDPNQAGAETVTSATVEGPVQFSMESQSRRKDPKTGAVSWDPRHVEGEADHLAYAVVGSSAQQDETEATSMLTLTGHVEIRERLLGAKLTNVAKAVIWFDRDMDVVKAKTSGAPAVVNVRTRRTGLLETGRRGPGAEVQGRASDLASLWNGAAKGASA